MIQRVKLSFFKHLKNTLRVKTDLFIFLNRNDLYLQHLFIFSSKQRDGAKDQLEQLEIQIGEFHIRAHLRQSVQKILYQNCCEEGRGGRICQEGVGNYL